MGVVDHQSFSVADNVTSLDEKEKYVRAFPPLFHFYFYFYYE